MKARYYLNTWVLFFLVDCTSSGYHGQSLFMLKMAAKYMGSELHQAFYTGWNKPAGEWRERNPLLRKVWNKQPFPVKPPTIPVKSVCVGGRG